MDIIKFDSASALLKEQARKLEIIKSEFTTEIEALPTVKEKKWFGLADCEVTGKEFNSLTRALQTDLGIINTQVFKVVGALDSVINTINILDNQYVGKFERNLEEICQTNEKLAHEKKKLDEEIKTLKKTIDGLKKVQEQYEELNADVTSLNESITAISEEMDSSIAELDLELSKKITDAEKELETQKNILDQYQVANDKKIADISKGITQLGDSTKNELSLLQDSIKNVNHNFSEGITSVEKELKAQQELFCQYNTENNEKTSGIATGLAELRNNTANELDSFKVNLLAIADKEDNLHIKVEKLEEQLKAQSEIIVQQKNLLEDSHREYTSLSDKYDTQKKIMFANIAAIAIMTALHFVKF